MTTMSRAGPALAAVAWAWLAAAGLAAEAPAPGASGPEAACDVPDDLTYSDVAFPAVAARLKAGEPVAIIVVGSGSSAGTGLTPPDRAYPERLAGDLAKRFPQARFTIDNLAKRGEPATAMVARIEKEVLPAHPALVIWQTGTVEAVHEIDLESFGTTLDAGLAALREHGVDTILMNMQYSPHILTLLDPAPYREAMRWAAQAHAAMLFDRFAIMRYWEGAGVVDFASQDKADQVRDDDLVHGCIAHLLGGMIAHAVDLARAAPQKP